LSVPAEAPELHEIFVYRALKDDRPLVILRGLQAPGSLGMIIEAEVHPVEAGARGPVLRRPYRFAARDQAMRFVDEALLALEYLDCQIA
jgi:hypothetical protein